MKDGIIIQARTGSTRLPNKILLPFYNHKSIIDILIENIKHACPDKTIVLATTYRSQDDVLEHVADEHSIHCYRGSEDNVLERFIGAANEYGMDRLIRVCSDNPFLQDDTFQVLFNQDDAHPADYLSYAFANGQPVIKSHLGLFSELTTANALHRVAKATNEKLYCEHVTNYLYAHPEQFNVRLLPLPAILENRHDLRFTLDTHDDFILLQKLYAEWMETVPHNIESLLHLTDRNNDHLQQMKFNIAHNEK